MIRVLFVCLGNICRSPMAEAVFAHLVRELGLEDRIAADSAGTGHWHLGERPHSGTRRILEQKGIRCEHWARLLSRGDLEAFDYIVTMDDENLSDVKAMGAGRAMIAPLMAYAPETGVREVPDPYYTGNFEVVYDLVEQSAAGLLRTIRQERGL